MTQTSNDNNSLVLDISETSNPSPNKVGKSSPKSNNKRKVGTTKISTDPTTNLL